MARNKYDVDEELETGFNLGYLRRLLKYMKPYKTKIVTSVILMLISSSLALLGPVIVKSALDNFIPNKEIKNLALISVLYVMIYVTIAIIMKHRMYTMGEVGQNILVDMRYDLFKNLQFVPFNYYDSRPHGKILVRVVNYINSLSDILSNGFVNLIADMVTLVMAIIFMSFLSIKLTLVTLMGIPILMIVMMSIKNAQRRAFQRLSAKQSNLNAYIHESINGVRVTQSFSRKKESMDTFKELCFENSDSWMKAVRFNFLIWPSIDIISVTSISLIYIFGILVFRDSVSLGLIAAFISYVWIFWAPIMNIGNFYNTLINAMAYLERIFEAMDEEPEYDKKDAIELKNVKGDVEFKNVHFEYEKDTTILENVNMRIKAGEKIALVGPTGAGKTTIVNLLSRFYRIKSGEILVDGININDVTLKSLRKEIGVMLQDPFVFSGTIMENIRYGRLDATDEEVIEASKIVRADDFIKDFKDGYNTYLNEQGNGLSVGQKQLISFARVLLSDPKILILDEATSSIDTETEALLQEGIEELLKGRTSFVIAHRLSTIVNSDKIMYIGDKQILEEGTHDSLIKQKGLYYNLYKSQYLDI
ncbi:MULTISPECIES: ABC transporter ATP-binding protein [unclassified Clostridium]|uniref:ABC transporter ATP-binding protein n=1 Tax=unclassified Clostridium TaxID=2614128 RepID=UPI00189A647A|nr:MULTISPECIES: ABC transporter ATP-binding protein [unclassified Clostridium]MCR1950642.1 ABC transporter ATP-binding protein/permease [Clostridium sp. DSM 100503]